MDEKKKSLRLQSFVLEDTQGKAQMRHCWPRCAFRPLVLSLSHAMFVISSLMRMRNDDSITIWKKLMGFRSGQRQFIPSLCHTVGDRQKDVLSFLRNLLSMCPRFDIRPLITTYGCQVIVRTIHSLSVRQSSFSCLEGISWELYLNVCAHPSEVFFDVISSCSSFNWLLMTRPDRSRRMFPDSRWRH